MKKFNLLVLLTLSINGHGQDVVSELASFDPSSCTGVPIAVNDLIHLLKPSRTPITIGSYNIMSRERTCYAIGGCSEWSYGQSFVWKPGAFDRLTQDVDSKSLSGAI